MKLLDKINSPADLKKLNIEELELLAEEIRQKIISVTERNGGHLASSLGAVDAIVAMYYVFDFPKDKLIFDVGHQAYAHKILSERKELFDTIRTEGGLSGFPNIFESEYDAFTAGHAGESISAALGYTYARDLLREDYYVIAFVGDGSFFNGENLEAMFSSDKKPQKLLIVLNDNGMSISKNGNGFYKMVSKITMRKHYSGFMSAMDKIFGWNFFGRWLKKLKASFKRSLDPYSMWDTVGLKYIGAFDGHKLKLLVKLFSDFKSSPRATLMHLKTKKGKGFLPAENSAEYYHGVSRELKGSVNNFSTKAGTKLVELAKENDKIISITAGMTFGTGMSCFKEAYPERLIDVGISEELAVTYAAGAAVAGLKPFVCIYSTFLQRSYDQIMTDVCLQKLPVTFLIDRAGVVGSDGCTHQGVFDLSYLSHMPNMTVLVPKDGDELEEMLDFAKAFNAPLAIRYPNGDNLDFENNTKFSLEKPWEIVKEGDGKVVLACGGRMLSMALTAAENKNALVVNARSVKPLDEKLLLSFVNREIITLEDNSKIGGFGSSVLGFYAEKGFNPKLTVLGIEDKFIEHAQVERQLEINGLSVEKLSKII